LTAPSGPGKTELAAAKQHYSQPNAATYEFSAYKGDDVVAALRDLFNKKCAYCESQFEAVAPVDIEHYRPKGGVKGDKTHPGYWWLAASWDNLLPSCIDCNRERYQHVATKGMTQRDLDAVKRILSGKKNAFPIAGTRARKHTDNHAAEDPLLIDPTRRDPEQHLSWEELTYQGHADALSIVSPKRVGGAPDRYADESIAIYGLNRRGLVERRTALLLSLKTEAARIESLAIATASLPIANIGPFLAIIENDFKNFLTHANDDREYSRCAKGFIDQAGLTLIQHLQALKAKIRAPATAHVGR
jgi:uncharacterized protein (TIGR02646 family)